MIQRFVPDILGVCLIVVFAIVLAVRQNMNMDARPQVVLRDRAQQKTAAARQEQKSIFNVAVSDDALKKKNVFAGSGSYAEVGAEIIRPPVPEKRYALIAILTGKEKRAVFRDDQGVVTALVVGKKMDNGFTIAGIDTVSVKLKKGKETKELKLFNVQYKPPLR